MVGFCSGGCIRPNAKPEDEPEHFTTRAQHEDAPVSAKGTIGVPLAFARVSLLQYRPAQRFCRS